VFTDYREMLARTRPDFVVALGQHWRMAETAHALLELGVPFMMSDPLLAPDRRGRRGGRERMT
jgi:hypothetical protein